MVHYLISEELLQISFLGSYENQETLRRCKITSLHLLMEVGFGDLLMKI